MRYVVIAISVVSFLVSTLPRAARAELTPEIQLGIHGVFSLDAIEGDGGSETTLVNFDDTSVLLGFRQKLYSDYRGKMAIGLKFNDPESSLGDIFYHHIFIGIEGERDQLIFGRSRIRNALIEFPTLRDDDALFFSDLLNPFASGIELESEDHQYGEILEASHLFGDRYWLRVHAGSLTEDQDVEFSINSAGVFFEYMMPETQRWNRNVLQQLGLGANFYLEVPEPGGGERTMTAAAASLALNIHPDPVDYWDLRSQVLYNAGVDGIGALADFADMTRTESLTVLTSLRYLNRKSEWPRAQLALTAGFRDLPDIGQDTTQTLLILNGLRRIGSGFDLGLQLAYLDNEGDLATLLGEDEWTLQGFLTFEFDARWNSQFDDRDSLLNLEHGYIP